MAGTALAAGALAVTAALAVACAATAAATVSAARLSTVADAAALAGADTASGLISGVPCERAESVVARTEARLEVCEVDGLTVTVRVTQRHGPFAAAARARAGPPP